MNGRGPFGGPFGGRRLECPSPAIMSWCQPSPVGRPTRVNVNHVGWQQCLKGKQ